jgi:hypothetical protein
MWSEDDLGLSRPTAPKARRHEGRFTQDQARAARREAARITAELDAGRRWWGDAWGEWTVPGSSPG